MKMAMPKKISTWMLIIYFLLVGLAGLGVALPAIIATIVALAAAVFLFLDR
jgi:hypothetical protein